MPVRATIDQLFEVHYSDLWPEAFGDLIKRYRGQADRGGDLYVNFTSRPDAVDPLARNAYTKPDHRDMVGTYAYPMWYVVKHPADLWYGFNAEHARVLKDISRNKLNLNDMSEDDAVQVLRDAGLDGYRQYKLAKKYLKDLRKGSTAPAKLMLAAIQFDLDAGRGSYWDGKFIPDEKHGWTWEYKVRSGAEQTALFRKAGIDAVEDDASRLSQAVINDREPHQICFLTRQAFEVVESVHLGKRGAYRTSRAVSTTFNTEHMERKLAQQVAEVMDDKLLGKRSNGAHIFYTVNGRAIKLRVHDTSINHRMSTLKLGQKGDRAHTVKTPHEIYIDVTTEYGDMRAIAFSDEKIQQAVDDLAQQWAKLAKDVPKAEWKKRSRVGDEEIEKQERYAYHEEKFRKDAEINAEDSRKLSERWNQLAQRLGVKTFAVPDDNYTRYGQYRRLTMLPSQDQLPLDAYHEKHHAEIGAARELITKARELGVKEDRSPWRFLDELEAKLNQADTAAVDKKDTLPAAP